MSKAKPWMDAFLPDICDIQIGKTPSRSNARYWNGDIPWVTISDLSHKRLKSTAEYITDEAVKECNCKLIPSGTLLMSFKLSIGKLGIAEVPLFTNEAIVGLLIKDINNLDQRFLYHCLLSKDFSVYGDKAVKGLTLNLEKLNAIKLSLPPLAEQKRIADILDAADSIRQKRKEAIAKLDQLAQSVFLEMFGDPVKNEKGWDVEMLRDSCEFITKGTTPKNIKVFKKYLPGLIPFLKVYNLSSNGGIDFTYNPSYIDHETHTKLLKRSNVFPNDVLMNIVGPPLGKFGIVNNSFAEWNVNQAIVIFRCKQCLNPLYLLNTISYPSFSEKIIQMAVGIRQLNLNLEQCRNIKIPIPPIHLQNTFSSYIIQLESTLELQKKALRQEELLFSSLQHRAFAGEL